MGYGIKETPTTPRPAAPYGQGSIGKRNEHEHKFVHLETKRSTKMSNYQSGWTRIDTFFCEKCLVYKDKKQEEWSRDKPSWY